MQKFLEPESVAVIGAPRQTGPGSFNNVETLLRYGYTGRVYPINPNATSICGLKTYPSVTALPEIPDLAVISIGRERVPGIVAECGYFGIRQAVIITQGFSDADLKGTALQEEILQLARQNNMRIIGPNTLGVINNYNRFTTSFTDLPFPEKFSPVSLIAQTGLIQVALGSFSFGNWGKAIDIGNGSDIDHVDALQYLADDHDTRVIVAHIEGLKRGREFLKIASKVVLQKPVIVFKTGRSSAGAHAALSHTGSMVGESEVADAAFRRAGILRVRDASNLKDAIHALLQLDPMKGSRLGILSASGAAGIMAADASEDYGLQLGELPVGLAENLKQGTPGWIHVGNPVDFWPLGMLGGGKFKETVFTALRGLLQAPDIDGVIAICPSFDSPLHSGEDFIETIREVRVKNGEKPLAVWTYPENSSIVGERFDSIVNTARFLSIERAVYGLACCHNQFKAGNRKLPVQKNFEINKLAAQPLINRGKAKSMLLGSDALDLLAAFGLPVVKSIAARSLKDLENVADDLGYPLVLKIASEAFIHKTEIGGVVTGIKNKTELLAAYKEIKENAQAKDPDVPIEFILQRQATGREILVGLKRDPQFGHVIACGAGGIYTEVIRDIAREMTPVDETTAKDMIKSLKIYPILKGIRGESGADISGLCELLERISFLAQTAPEITELDINPIMVSKAGCLVVDARIIWQINCEE
ncbi:MAG: acetate--CoA ligase family protein [Smithellaceae bacterium]